MPATPAGRPDATCRSPRPGSKALPASRTSVALAVAAVVHFGAIELLDRWPWSPGRIAQPAAVLPAADATPTIAWVAPTAVAAVTLLEVDVARLPLLALPGPGDAVSAIAQAPLPSASADLPGARAADRGGGDIGGAATWTGRRDRSDDAALRAEPWTGADDYVTPHRDRERRAASPEAISRAPARSYGDRARARAAAAGDLQASQGDREAGTGTAADAPAPAWTAAEPVTASAGRTTPTQQDGASRPTSEDALVDRGAPSADVPRRGRLGDDVDTAAHSAQTNPDPFDLTPVRSGGTSEAEGVAGRRPAPGLLADGHRAPGTAASTADVPVGGGSPTTYAERQDPYFRDLYRRLDQLVVFPHDLKLDLRQGRVVATLVLHADGKVSDIYLEISSGYRGFDDQVVGALRRLGPLPPVPRKLLVGRARLKVVVPYIFKNPLIR